MVYFFTTSQLNTLKIIRIYKKVKENFNYIVQGCSIIKVKVHQIHQKFLWLILMVNFCFKTEFQILIYLDVLAQSSKAGSGLTASDIYELRRICELNDSIPRRSVSMSDFTSVSTPVEKVLPQTIPENDESFDNTPDISNKEKEKSSPRRKIPQPMTPARECESLEKVQAFKMPDGETVQEIRS